MHMRSQKFSGKNKTLSSITPRPPLSSSSRRKSSVNTNSVKSGSQISFKQKDKVMSDSQSSDASCIDNKFYRCACLKQKNGHHQKYQNYLAELREERMKKKQKLIQYFANKETQSDVLVLSDDDRELDNVWAQTPPRESTLQKIAEISQSAQYSQKKFDFTIQIDFAGHRYFKRFPTKEQAKACLNNLCQILNGGIS